MTKAHDRMTPDEMVGEMQALDEQITALREQKRALGRRYDEALTEARARSVLDGMSPGERDAIARISTLTLGADAQAGGNE